MIRFAGSFKSGDVRYRWEPQERDAAQLLAVDDERTSRTLAVLGHKQRLDILLAVLREPLTGPELVEQLHMGTTGQLYHHMKALVSADLVVQEERGGRYAAAAERTLPLLLLLAAANELTDTSRYLELAEVRSNADAYLGHPASGAYDPHHLLRAVLENALSEHEAGCCTEVAILLQPDGSITVSDNGRGIPTSVISGGSGTSRAMTQVEAVLTEMRSGNPSGQFQAPGAGRGINMPVVNALSERLSVEVRRDGRICRQDFRNGLPQTELHVIGLTGETGTSVTFRPDREIFAAALHKATIQALADQASARYPALRIHVIG